MSGRVYGYARVSTKHQKEDRQLIALREYGVSEKHIVVEKQSGKDFDRPGYQKLLRRLRPGDTLVIQSLDRLGRNYEEIQEQWRVIRKDRGVSIVVLDMPILNTQENAELIFQVMTDLVLQMLSFIAQTERENIRTRQREGIAAAKARGVRFGRPRMELPEEFPAVVARWNRGELTSREAARVLGISRTTFFRRVKELAGRKKSDGNDEIAGQAQGGERMGLRTDESPAAISEPNSAADGAKAERPAAAAESAGGCDGAGDVQRRDESSQKRQWDAAEIAEAAGPYRLRDCLPQKRRLSRRLN